MREIFTYGSVGGAPGNRCFYLEEDFQTCRGFCKKTAKATPALKAPDEGVMFQII